MPTIVDELVVRLGLDAAPFKKGQREVSDAWKKAQGTQLKHAALMEGSNKKLMEGFNKLKFEALAFLAVLVGAHEIKEFIANVTSANAAVGRLAANIGEQPQMLQAWGAAVERMGGNAQDASTSLTKVSKAFYDLKYNGTALPKEVYQLFALAGKPVPTSTDSLDSFLNKTAAALKELATHDRTAAFFFGEGMGLSDSMINLMLKYGDATSKYVGSLKGLGATDKQIENSQKLIDKFETLKQTVVQIGTDIMNWFSPFFLGALDKVQKVFDAIHRATGMQGPQDLSPAQKLVRHGLHLDRWDAQDGKNANAPASAAAPGWAGKGAPPSIRARGAKGRGGAGSAPAVDLGGATIPGFTAAETQSYLGVLGQRESGNKYIGNNSLGYGGRWQMGEREVAGTGSERNADWYANKDGAQDKSMMRYTLQHYNDLTAKGIIKPGMSKQEIAGYLAAAHLGGVGGAQALAQGSSRADANGTGTSDYFRMMSGIGGDKPGSASGADADGPVVFGDSIAQGVKDYSHSQGAAMKGMGASWVTDQIKNYGEDLKGRKVVLSTGASNSNDPDAVAKQLYALSLRGVAMKDITVLGVGDKAGFAGYNDRLKAISDYAGAKFQPIDPGADHVHPKSYKKLWDGIQGSGVPGPQSSLSTLHAVHPVTTSSTSNAMHIGAIHVNAPHATDASGIAGEIHKSLSRYQLAMSGQSGQV